MLRHIEKKQQIESARQRVGWVYRDLLWFAKEAAEQANQERNELLEALAGWVTLSCLGTKPHFGPLSPGCIICGTGGWGCNFINGLCSRRCFYCPQEHMKAEPEPQTDGIIFKTPQEHVSFIKIFQIRGVGFSGGEPFLALDTLLAHIKAIRQEFGNSVYLWIYTNGDRVNRGSLKILQKAGVDEIRLDISARKYDLAPVHLAKEYIPTVTVEIPAIPEDFDLVKGLLGRMEAAGINFLNLHQLNVTEYNYKAFRRRNYHFLHQPYIAVFETEICALKLLLFARENQIGLPINYCSSIYKSRFQGRDVLARKSRILIKGFEEITNAGYIRSFRVLDAPDRIKSMVRRLEEANCPPERWQSDARQTELAIYSELLPYVDWSSADVSLQYWEPGIGLKEPKQGLIEGNIAPNNVKVYQEQGWSRAAIESWRKLYLEKMNPKEVFRSFYQDYPMAGKGDIARLQQEADNLKKVAAWEELASGLPEIY